MTRPAVIFDLDDTLVDTSELLTLRKARRWSDCYRNLQKTHIYPGILEVISTLVDNGIPNNGIPIGIVTTSISDYAERVLKHHGIPYDALVAYHDCRGRQKPNPDPVLLCLNRLNCTPIGSLGIGDAANDAQAYVRAEITAWGAGWSSGLERNAEWDDIIETPMPIVSFFQSCRGS